MCVFDVRHLPEVAMCVIVLGGVQVLCGEEACFFSLLLLLSHAPGPEYTNTQLWVNSRHLSASALCMLVKNVCFYLQVWLQRGFGFTNRLWGKQVNSVLKINTAMMQHSKSDLACLHCIKNIYLAK